METIERPAHLTIGEVLALLRNEFPDITISKIRFLESQGLIVPERTSSGYRRFYDPDIARLRWVLRQQRDHFLPLKVIKAKLDSNTEIDLTDEAAVQPNLWAGSEQEPPSFAADFEHERRVGIAGQVSQATPIANGNGHTRPGAPVLSGTTQPPGRNGASAGSVTSSTAASTGSAQTSSAQTGSAQTGSAQTGSAQLAPAQTGSAQPEPAQPGSGETGPAQPDSGETASATSTEPTSKPRAPRNTARTAGQPSAKEDPGSGARTWLEELQTSPSASRGADGPEVAVVAVDGALRFGIHEVSEVTGLDIATLQSLVTYGMLTPSIVGGEETFDPSSIAVARAVAAFLDRGVEIRHLRSYKNSADREAGFLEQMILPLLKRRNPQARAAASETLAQMVREGSELQTALVNQALHRHLG
jgi:DNA-binding transcriptional MerR regulator